MSLFDLLQFFLFLIILAILTPSLGTYLAKVFQGELSLPIFRQLEHFSYQIAAIDTQEMNGKQYLRSMLLFNLLGFLFLLLILLVQNILPFNPEHFGSVKWPLAFNTAMSFVTNTNWQAYAGETTLSYGTQMFGMTVQNFLSAATGISALIALIRGVNGKSIGNFWVDIVRAIVYVLLPLSILLAFLLVSQGVIQTLSPYVEAITLENSRQIIPLGPVASQISIKQLGTNGGGFFTTNSAHPFENPTAFSNLLELISIVLIPASFTYAYGLMANCRKHASLLLLTMFLIWLGGLAISIYSESLNNPLLNAQPLLEGKELRFGATNLLWSVSTTATSNGSVNCMHDSLSPLAGGVCLFNIMLGELVFGGAGVGLCSMLMFVLLTVFLSGLMVGRTPEYRGKKIEKREMQWVSIAILVPSALILIGAGFSIVFPEALGSLKNRGPHGLSEMLYAFSSSSGNNGSAFAGLNADTNYFNIILGIFMLVGRLSILIPSVAIADLLSSKKTLPISSGTFSTNTFLFLSLLLGVILIIGALTFFPALSLGPLIEHFLMLKGESF